MKTDRECSFKLLKICIGTWQNASRDKRELSACQELGMDVAVLAKGEEDDRGRIDQVDGFKVYRYTSRPLKKGHVLLNRLVAIFAWARFAKNYHPDIISGHDMEGLIIAWIATWFTPKTRKPRLIYDSHEFELGRYVKRGTLKWSIVRICEKFLMSKCAFSIMVNDSIADEVQRIHKFETRPIVVRNIPDNWVIDVEECNRIKEEILSSLRPDGRILLMHHGIITMECGIDKLFEVTEIIPEVRLALVGQMDPTTHQQIEKALESKGIRDCVYLHDAVPISQLWKYAGAADVGMVTLPPLSESYYYCLPNKLFENIQAMTPVVVTDLPELKKVVEQYHVGWVVQNTTESIASCIKNLLSNPQMLNSMKGPLFKAKNELCWGKEREVIKRAYSDLVNGR